MKPVIPHGSEGSFSGDGCADLPFKRESYTLEFADGAKHEVPALVTVWEPSENERKAIARGGLIILTVLGDRHPPVSLTATPQEA